MDDTGITRLTAVIVAAYLKNNLVPPDEMAGLIRMVHETLVGLSTPFEKPVERTPAVAIRRSVTNEFITCLDCGYQGQMIKRHLATRHNLTPEQYRLRWGLSPDYPMLAHGYSEKRSALAKRIGLGSRGRPRRQPPPADPPVEPEPVEAAFPPRNRQARRPSGNGRRRPRS